MSRPPLSPPKACACPGSHWGGSMAWHCPPSAQGMVPNTHCSPLPPPGVWVAHPTSPRPHPRNANAASGQGGLAGPGNGRGLRSQCRHFLGV